jgi:DNA-binding transcriptional ArsR family regulator
MALGDPVRRRIIARLSRGPATVNELAEPFQITKQAVSKHIQVLEQAGLVTRTRDAQRRPVHLDAAQLEALTAWIDRYRLIHEQQFRTLDSLLATDRGTNAAPSVADSTDSTDSTDDPGDTPDADPSAGTSERETGQ